MEFSSLAPGRGHAAALVRRVVAVAAIAAVAGCGPEPRSETFPAADVVLPAVDAEVAHALERLQGAAPAVPREGAMGEVRVSAGGVTARFDASGVHLAGGVGAISPFSVSIAVTGVGRADTEAVPLAATAPHIEGDRVTYTRSGGLVEWYQGGPRGIEQGFTLEQAPRGEGELTIEMDVEGGLRADAVGPETLAWRSEDDRVGLRYGHLYVEDARGEPVPAWIRATGDRLAIAIDDADAVYPLRVDPLFGVETRLVGSATMLGDDLGEDVAVDGNTLLVGAPGEEDGTGAAYVFVFTGGGWAEQARLTSGVAFGRFGVSVALSGETAVVGAPDSEAAYVFIRSGAVWTLQATLTASDGVAGADFGTAVALRGDTALVGAPSTSGGANKPSAGAAYVYARSGVVWSQQAKLAPNTLGSTSRFGDSVSVDGDTAAVGAPQHDESNATNRGSAFVFVRSGNVWAEQAKLLASDSVAGDRVGGCVAVSGDTLLVGAPFESDAGVSAGATYVFGRSGNVWSQQVRLDPNGAAAGDRFGWSCALLGDSALIGAAYDDAPGVADAGSAFLFARAGVAWTEQKKFSASAAESNVKFGDAVALTADTVLVGAPGSLGTGAAYAYRTLPVGAPCANAAECATACVDGVCCSSGCAGGCDACALAKTGQPDGTCAPVLAGTDPDADCTDDGAPSCGENGLCDGAGACALYPGPGCVPSACASDASCSSGHCEMEPGEPSGICCDAACTGPCRSCRASVQGPGGVDGACLPIAAGADPREECPPDAGFPASCGADGTCNGAGACRAFALAGITCGPSTCDDGVVSGPACNGGGTCVAGAVVSCGGFACTAAGCVAACAVASDCAADFYCSAPECLPKKPKGAAARSGLECVTGFAVDGVCCESACAGQCEFCASDDTLGTCVGVVGAPLGDRPPCPAASDADPCSEATCDGIDRASCGGFPGTDTVCRAAGCDEGDAVAESRCARSGVCPALVAVDCGAYACADATCLTSCDTDAACAVGARCIDGECTSAPVCDGDHTLEGATGALTDCAPYRCEIGGGCLAECASSSDCVQGFVCDSGGACLPREEPAPAAAEPGCGCAVPGAAPDPYGARTALGLALALLAWRRRRAAATRSAAALLALGAIAFTGACASAPPEPTAAHRPDDPFAVLDRGPVAEARSAAHGLVARFDSDGVELTSDGQPDSWRVSMRLTGVGRDDVTSQVRRGARAITGRRVAYLHDGVTEWYDNGPLGLEQGFDLAERSPGEGPLVLELELEGTLAPAQVTRGTAVALLDGSGRTVLRYGGLHVVDAHGASVPSWLESTARSIRLHVEDRDATYPIVVDPLFSSVELLVANDAASLDGLGRSVSARGDRILVGAPGDDDKGVSSGSVYVFARTAGFTQQAKLLAPDGTASDNLGVAVALDGDTAVGGAFGAENGGTASGAAYVWFWNGASWGYQARVSAPDAAANDNFGYAVDVSGNTLIATAPADDTQRGAAYVFVRSGNAWSFQAKLVAADGASLHRFGHDVALEGDTALVGAPGAGGTGAVYVFVRTGLTWSQQAKLVASDAAAQDDFGIAVALSSDQAAVGAPGKDAGGVSSAGQGYVFVRAGAVWSESAKLTGPTPVAFDLLGSSVAISGTAAIVGVPQREVGALTNAGAMVAFDRVGAVWSLTGEIVAEVPSTNAYFGTSVDLAGTSTAVAGAPSADAVAVDGGAAYAFEALDDGEPCGSAAQCASGACVNGVCCDTSCTAPCLACVAAQTGQPDGSCSPVLAATDPGSDCADEGAPACSANGLCNGLGACATYAGPGCTPEPCATGSDCATGQCAKEPGDAAGICCDTSCSSPCSSCRASLQGPGGVDGVCGPIPADEDPRDACPTDPGFPASCLADGLCDGFGACRPFALPSQICAQTSCAADAVQTVSCDGSGQCDVATVIACAPYACVGASCQAACATSADCAEGAYCDALGSCIGLKADGTSATSPDECASGFVADGLCCSGSCAGQCEACDMAGSLGSCVAVVGAPRGDRPPCAPAGAGPCGATECDGDDRTTCAGHVGVDLVCAAPTCIDGVSLPESRCDGLGSCPPQESIGCGAYACGASACNTSCAADADCAATNRCDPSGVCVSGTICDGDHTLVAKDGTETDCSPFRCAASGVCLQICGSTLDCVQGRVCSAAGECVARDDGAPPADEGGCGCRLPATSGAGSASSVLAALLAFVAHRRRRRRRPASTRPAQRANLHARSEAGPAAG